MLEQRSEFLECTSVTGGVTEREHRTGGVLRFDVEEDEIASEYLEERPFEVVRAEHTFGGGLDVARDQPACGPKEEEVFGLVVDEAENAEVDVNSRRICRCDSLPLG